MSYSSNKQVLIKKLQVSLPRVLVLVCKGSVMKKGLGIMLISHAWSDSPKCKILLFYFDFSAYFHLSSDVSIGIFHFKFINL